MHIFGSMHIFSGGGFPAIWSLEISVLDAVVSNSDLGAKFGLIFNLDLVNSRYARVDQTQVKTLPRRHAVTRTCGTHTLTCLLGLTREDY